MTRTTTGDNRSTARKLVGSLGVLGVAAAVAGLGTYGGFTDSTTPITATVETGTLSISLSQPDPTLSLTAAGFVPGDSMTRAIDLVNDGTASFGSLTLSSVASVSSVLTTDLLNGLQLTVEKCSVAWTQGGTAETPTYGCTGTRSLVGAGPAASNMALNGAAALEPGGTDHLVFALSLPGSAGNEFQGATASLQLTVVGAQRAGGAR